MIIHVLYIHDRLYMCVNSIYTVIYSWGHTSLYLHVDAILYNLYSYTDQSEIDWWPAKFISRGHGNTDGRLFSCDYHSLLFSGHLQKESIAILKSHVIKSQNW